MLPIAQTAQATARLLALLRLADRGAGGYMNERQVALEKATTIARDAGIRIENIVMAHGVDISSTGRSIPTPPFIAARPSMGSLMRSSGCREGEGEPPGPGARRLFFYMPRRIAAAHGPRPTLSRRWATFRPLDRKHLGTARRQGGPREGGMKKEEPRAGLAHGRILAKGPRSHALIASLEDAARISMP